MVLVLVFNPQNHYKNSPQTQDDGKASKDQDDGKELAQKDSSLGAVCQPHPACPALATPGLASMAADAIARCADASTENGRRPWSVLIRGKNVNLPLPCGAPVVVGIPGGPGQDVGVRPHSSINIPQYVAHILGDVDGGVGMCQTQQWSHDHNSCS